MCSSIGYLFMITGRYWKTACCYTCTVHSGHCWGRGVAGVSSGRMEGGGGGQGEGAAVRMIGRKGGSDLCPG